METGRCSPPINRTCTPRAPAGITWGFTDSTTTFAHRTEVGSSCSWVVIQCGRSSAPRGAWVPMSRSRGSGPASTTFDPDEAGDSCAPAMFPAPRKPIRRSFSSWNLLRTQRSRQGRLLVPSCRDSPRAQCRSDVARRSARHDARRQPGGPLIFRDPDGFRSDPEGTFDVRSPGVANVE